MSLQSKFKGKITLALNLLYLLTSIPRDFVIIVKRLFIGLGLLEVSFLQTP